MSESAMSQGIHVGTNGPPFSRQLQRLCGAAFLSALLLGTGCSAKKLYPGPERNMSQLARVYAYENGLFIDEVDAHEAMIGTEGRLRDLTRLQSVDALLLPGEHTFLIQYYSPEGRREARIKADLTAGKKYIFKVLRTIIPSASSCETLFPDIRTADGKLVGYFPLLIDIETDRSVSTVVGCAQVKQ